MKKLLIIVMAAGLIISFAASDVFARGIIIKGGWAMMRNDLEDMGAEDTWNFGLFFDMGTFLFDSLRFKPGVDYVSLETEEAEIYDVYGIHLDWYWYPMGNAALSPFLGFGPSLNYNNYQDDRDNDEDSDAGVDLFAGVALGISGTPFELFIEARYRFLDIAARNENILAFNLGVQYRF